MEVGGSSFAHFPNHDLINHDQINHGLIFLKISNPGEIMQAIEQIEKEMIRMDLPDFNSGDTVIVWVKISEGGKERLQAFQGVVISKRKGTVNATFTVRKVSYGIGVERIFPLYSPRIDKIEVIKRGRVRRSKIYYLRKLRGKATRIKERRIN